LHDTSGCSERHTQQSGSYEPWQPQVVHKVLTQLVIKQYGQGHKERLGVSANEEGDQKNDQWREQEHECDEGLVGFQVGSING